MCRLSSARPTGAKNGDAVHFMEHHAVQMGLNVIDADVADGAALKPPIAPGTLAWE